MPDSHTAQAPPTGHVLLVEDEPALRRGYARMLERSGHTVTQLGEGGEVPDVLGRSDFDAVVSDIGLPGMTGIEILRVVRQRDPDLPVVLMTASGDLETAMKAVEHGALRYLLKPIDPVVLGDAVTEAIRLRRLAKTRRLAFELYGEAVLAASQRSQVAARFEDALTRLHMAYQPIIRWSGREVFAHEALVRCDEPTLRRPDQLFAAAESLAALFPLGRAIRRLVAATMSQHESHTIFVNVHPSDLEDDDLFARSAPLSQVAGRVVLEVTERAALDRVPDARARLASLRALGYRVALDDLGAGYAGLTSFVQFQPEVVKLDMTLTRNIDSEPNKRRLVESLTQLSKDLGIMVVAEGVETRAERDTLVATGCDYLQGYLFAKPGPPFPPPAALHD